MKLQIPLLCIGLFLCIFSQVYAAGSNGVDELDAELRTAAFHGDLNTVEQLIEQGAKINYDGQYDRSTPLINAAYEGHTEIVKLLIRKGVEVNQADRDGSTALIGAAAEGYTEIAKLLLDNNADASAADLYGNTALIMAASLDHTDIVELLCEKQINVYLKDEQGKTAYDYGKGNSKMIKAIERHMLPPKNSEIKNNY